MQLSFLQALAGWNGLEILKDEKATHLICSYFLGT